MKKKSLIITAALSAMVLAGCGNNDDGKLKVIFWHTFGDKIQAGVNAKIEAFKALIKNKEGVDIEVVSEQYGSYKDTQNIVGTALMGATGPSMCIAYPDSVAYLMSLEASDQQYVRRVDQYFEDNDLAFGNPKQAYLGDEEVDDFIRSYLEEGAQFQKMGTYVMPFMKSSEIMIYNKTAIHAVMPYYRPDITGDDIDDFVSSMSWDDLIGMARKAVEKKGDIGLTAMEEPIFYDSDSNMLITQIEQLGLDYSTLDASGNVVLGLDKDAAPENYAKVKKILEDYRSWHNDGLITTKNTEGEYASDSFKNMKCIFTIGSSGGAGYTFPQTDDMEIGICKVPYRGENGVNPKYISQGPSVVFLNDKSYSQEKNDKIFEYSWKLYRYLTNTDNNVELCANNSEGYVPVRESCYKSELWSEFIREGENYAQAANVVKRDIGDNFISSLVFKGSAVYRDQMTGLVGSVMSKSDSIDSLVATAVSNTKTNM